MFSRAKLVAQLTPEGELFYGEALRTLVQAEAAINTAKRAAKGETGQLAIGFLGSATYAFLPELVRKYKAQFPGVKLTLQELTPQQQEIARLGARWTDSTTSRNTDYQCSHAT